VNHVTMDMKVIPYIHTLWVYVLSLKKYYGLSVPMT
jgi:hypothetical protein